MISAPIPGACSRRNASSMPPLPPGSPTISRHHRVANIHSCSRSPAWPKGASWLRPSPVPNPSSEIEKNWTRVSDMAGTPSCDRSPGGAFARPGAPDAAHLSDDPLLVRRQEVEELSGSVLAIVGAFADRTQHAAFRERLEARRRLLLADAARLRRTSCGVARCSRSGSRGHRLGPHSPRHVSQANPIPSTIVGVTLSPSSTSSTEPASLRSTRGA